MQSRADNGEQALPDLLTQQEGMSQKHETFLIKIACFVCSNDDADFVRPES